jgi:hypothetical protein
MSRYIKCIYVSIFLYIYTYIHVGHSKAVHAREHLQEQAPANWDFLNDEYILSHRDINENMDSLRINATGIYLSTYFNFFCFVIIYFYFISFIIDIFLYLCFIGSKQIL